MKNIASLILIFSEHFHHHFIQSITIIMLKRLFILSIGLITLGSIASLSSCGGNKGGAADSAAAANSNTPTGAGSTFINPIMTHWASEYQAQDSVVVNYQSVG